MPNVGLLIQHIGISAKSLEECVQLVSKSLDEKQKVAVIANLLDIAMADGVLAGAEKKLMMLYLNSFQISEDIIKNYSRCDCYQK